MKLLCPLVMFASMLVRSAAPVAVAQTTQKSNLNLGIAWQNDNLYQRGVRVSPIGLVTGLGWQPDFGRISEIRAGREYWRNGFLASA
jgi:hypothetical protein